MEWFHPILNLGISVSMSFINDCLVAERKMNHILNRIRPNDKLL